MMKNFFSYIVFVFVLIPVICFAAEPSDFGASGTFLNGSTITVTGVNFGTPRTADHYQYFDDYTSDWSCNSPGSNPQTACSAFPSSGSYFSNDSDWFAWGFTGSIMKNYGDPLQAFDDTYTNYSTGRALYYNLEYYSGSSGEPNDSFWLNFPETDTIFFVYYLYYDPNWNSGHTVQEKNVELFLNDGAYPVMKWNPWSPSHLTPQFSNGCSSCDANNDTGTIQFPASPGEWMEVKIRMTMNSTGSSTDGVIQTWLNGVQDINDSTSKLRDTTGNHFGGGPTANKDIGLGNNFSGGFTMPGSGNELVRAFDDFLMNRSSTDPCGGVFPCIAIVYLSNQSTWGSGPTDKLNGDGNFVRQKVGGTANADLGFKSWSDTGLKFEYNEGSLSGSNRYLYVWSWDGTVNSSGYDLNGAPPSPTITVTATDSNASENGGTGQYTIWCSPDCTGENIYFTMSGSATETTDYSLSSQTYITIGSGGPAASGTILLTPIDDSDIEGTETATITITADPNYTLGSPITADINITDNDFASISGTGGVGIMNR